MKWTGNIIGRREFELTSCKVNKQYNGMYHPSAWSCLEDGYHFWQRSWVGVVMAIVFTIGGTFYGVAAGRNENVCVVIILGAILFAIAILVSVMLAGIVGFIVIISPFIILLVVL